MTAIRVVGRPRLLQRIFDGSVLTPRPTVLSSRPCRQQQRAPSRGIPVTQSLSHIRYHSTHSERPTSYDFSGIQSIVESPSTERLLIDVRESAEYQKGFIPSAINIPIASQPDALFLPEEEFEDRFGFKKPSTNHELVFYCKAGVRSSAAALMAKQGGYEKVGEYRGSWLDWEKKGGSSSR